MMLGALAIASCTKNVKIDETPAEPRPAKLCLTVVLADEFNAIPGTEANPVNEITINGIGDAPVLPTEIDYKAGEIRKSPAVAEYECQFAPQETAAGKFGVNMEISGTPYQWSAVGSVKFEGDRRYSVMLTIAADRNVTASEVFESDWDTRHEFEIEMSPMDADVWDGSIAKTIKGSGTEEDPFLITSGAELAYIAQETNSRVSGTFSKRNYYKLMRNIDLANKKWTPIGYFEPEADGTGTGTAGCGIFDGNGKTIMNLKVDQTGKLRSAGLFGNNSGGSFRNLTICNADIVSDCYAGILCGSITNDPTIENCHVSGMVKITDAARGRAGGMVGDASYLTAKNCSANVTINGTGYTGGFVGNAFSCSFENCTVKGKTDGAWSVGGFAGVLFYNSTAKNCIADVDVTAYDWNCGGFVGWLEGEKTTISDCKSYGKVHSTVSGFAHHCGGFIGGAYNDVNVSKCSCYTEVTIDTPSETSNGGAFLGYDKGNVKTTECHYSQAHNPQKLEAIGVTEEGAKSTHDITAE